MDEIFLPQRGIISGFEKAEALDVPPVNEYAAVRPIAHALSAVLSTRSSHRWEKSSFYICFSGELVVAALSHWIINRIGGEGEKKERKLCKCRAEEEQLGLQRLEVVQCSLGRRFISNRTDALHSCGFVLLLVSSLSRLMAARDRNEDRWCPIEES